MSEPLRAIGPPLGSAFGLTHSRDFDKLSTKQPDEVLDPDEPTSPLDPSTTFTDADAAAFALLDYLESAGNTPAIEELISCILADSDVQSSPSLRRSLETFGALLCARVDP